MRQFFMIAFVFTLLGGCKKAVEKAQEDALIGRITDGRWKVTTFTKEGKSMTPDFAPYEFQFHKNNTVDAYKNSIFEKTGSWQGDVNSQTITSDFTNATYPLELLNGSWKITNSTWTSVEAYRISSIERMTLRLDKL